MFLSILNPINIGQLPVFLMQLEHSSVHVLSSMQYFFFNRQECTLFNVLLRSCKVVIATLKLCCILLFHCNCHLYAYILQNFMMFFSKDIREKCIASLGINIYKFCVPVPMSMPFSFTCKHTHAHTQIHRCIHTLEHQLGRKPPSKSTYNVKAAFHTFHCKTRGKHLYFCSLQNLMRIFEW